MIKITKEQARNFLLRHQRLDGTLSGCDGILEYIKTAGCVQYDPLNVAGRNADLVMAARVVDYREDMLADVLYSQRMLIDGWDKQMSIYNRDDWPYFSRVREQKGIEVQSYLKYRDSEEALLHTDAVLEFLAKNGPAQSKGIKLGKAGTGTWGHKSIAGAVMDYLFNVGKIGVATKLGVNKVYDLIENLLPAEILNAPDPFATDQDFYKWYVLRRLGGVGMLRAKNGGGWLGYFVQDGALRRDALDELVVDGAATEVEVEGLRAKFYLRAEDLPKLRQENTIIDKTVRFIAPLDNLIWDRQMISSLFDFDYGWEVYTPVAKRKYGYYVLPVLFDGRFVARFEPLQSKTHMVIKNWWWEKGVAVTPGLVDAAMVALERHAVCFGKSEGVHEDAYKIIKR